MIRTDKLRQLAEHLLHGQLGHEIFDFFQYNNATEPRCGTAGCGIGECPIVWPDEWEWDVDGFPVIIGYCGTPNSGESFFSISDEQYGHLFFPNGQIQDWGEILSGSATKEQVANNILTFCNKVDSGEIV